MSVTLQLCAVGLGQKSGSCLAKDNSLEKEQLRAVSSQPSQQVGDGDTSW